MSQPTSSQQNDFTISNFFKRLNEEGVLYAVSCRECGAKMIPPRPLCNRCSSTSGLEWFVLPSQGRVVAFSEIHFTNNAFQKLVPYVVAIAEFGGNDLKIPGTVRGAKREEVKIGALVKVKVKTPSAVGDSETNMPSYWFEL